MKSKGKIDTAHRHDGSPVVTWSGRREAVLSFGSSVSLVALPCQENHKYKRSPRLVAVSPPLQCENLQTFDLNRSANNGAKDSQTKGQDDTSDALLLMLNQ